MVVHIERLVATLPTVLRQVAVPYRAAPTMVKLHAARPPRRQVVMQQRRAVKTRTVTTRWHACIPPVAMETRQAAMMQMARMHA